MRRATWILWLMLALLPLRGWAAATMALPAIAPQGSHAIAAHHDDAAALPLPCHAAAEPSGDAPADGARPDSGSCHACDGCHASLAVPAPVGLASVALPATPPRGLAARDTGRRPVGGLERPPRQSLA